MNSQMNQHPVLGIIQTLATFFGGLTVMELTQGIISIIAGLMTIVLLSLQIRKALRS